MIPARFTVTSPITGIRAIVAALATGVLVGGCYYPAYPDYPAYYYPTVPAAYTQREFAVPAQGASGAATASAPGATYSTAQVEYQYVAASPSADYYAVPAYPYYAPYPAYAAYPAYPPYYGWGYPAISIGFGYWGGGGCCWGHGWHGGGWRGGGGWHGGGTSWQGGHGGYGGYGGGYSGGHGGRH